MTTAMVSNRQIARLLDDIARLLEMQHANPFKVRAYRSGARYVRDREAPLAGIVYSGGGAALEALPHIGESLAAVIEEYVKTGKSQLLQRLKGQITPEELFEQVPGVGKKLAGRIVRELDIRSLEDLEQKAHDGSLFRVEGFGQRRVEAIRLSLAGLLSGFGRRRLQQELLHAGKEASPQPSVALLLEVDAAYRRKATANTLKTITPRRFNPAKEAWLPVWHTDKDGWSFTALYSNTARAHELGKTHDWVVIFFERNGYEGQSTVVTETGGPLAGKRVVRGREEACMAQVRQR